MTVRPGHGQGGLRHRPARGRAARSRRSASSPASSSSSTRSGSRCATRSSAPTHAPHGRQRHDVTTTAVSADASVDATAASATAAEQAAAQRRAAHGAARRWSGSRRVAPRWSSSSAAGSCSPREGSSTRSSSASPVGHRRAAGRPGSARHRVRLDLGAASGSRSRRRVLGFLLGVGRRRRRRRRCSARTGSSPTCSAPTSRSSTRSRASSSARSSSSPSASGMPPKVLLAAVLVFFVVFFNAFQGVREVDRNLVANARVLGASPLQVTRHVIVPSALTWIIASLHMRLRLRHHRRARRRGPRRPAGPRPGHQPGAGQLRPQRRVRRDGRSSRSSRSAAECLIAPARAPAAVLAAAGHRPRPPRHLTPPRSTPHSPVNSPSPIRSNRKVTHHVQTHHDRRRGAVAALAAGSPRGASQQPAASGSSAAGAGSGSALPTVKLMVGGIDKQIYLPYQLAQNLGFYKKYGVNVELSHRAERRRRRRGRDGLRARSTWPAPGTSTPSTSRPRARTSIDVVQLSGAPGEREMCANELAACTRPPTSRARPSASPTSARAPTTLTQFLAAQQPT